MDEQSLALSFGNSLSEDVAGIVGEYAELGLDALVEEGLFKDIPLVSTVASVYRIGQSIREKHHIVKLISFLNEIHTGIADEDNRQKYREKFATNKKFRNQELEYILILVERYISFEKPQMLAKLYFAYLDGAISWDEFTKYAEVIDKLLYGDVQYLKSSNLSSIKNDDYAIDAVLRLQSVGLVAQNVTPTTNYNPADGALSINGPTGYVVTPLGEKLINLL